MDIYILSPGRGQNESHERKQGILTTREAKSRGKNELDSKIQLSLTDIVHKNRFIHLLTSLTRSVHFPSEPINGQNVNDCSFVVVCLIMIVDCFYRPSSRAKLSTMEI